jgi:hypothetical protein
LYHGDAAIALIIPVAERSLLERYRSVCSGRGNFLKALASLVAENWEPTTDNCSYSKPL